MSKLSIRLPDSLHGKIKELASGEGVSINQFITLAAAEKVSALLTVDYLRERGSRGQREVFESVLAKVPGGTPEASDRLD